MCEKPFLIRQGCHFDPFGKQGKLREKSFLDPSHSLGMTALPVTWRTLRSFDVAQDMLCASHLFSDWLHIQSQFSPRDEPPAL